MHSDRYVKKLPPPASSPHWRVVGHHGFAQGHVDSLFPGVDVPQDFMHGCSPPTPEEAKRLDKVHRTPKRWQQVSLRLRLLLLVYMQTPNRFLWG